LAFTVGDTGSTVATDSTADTPTGAGSIVTGDKLLPDIALLRQRPPVTADKWRSRHVAD